MAKEKDYDFSFSPSTLHKFEECPRCFWDATIKDIEYRGIFAGITQGIDRVMKGYADGCRMIGCSLPIELVGKVPLGTKLYGTVAEIKKFRHWASNPWKVKLTTKSGKVVNINLALDELFVHHERGYSPADWKSKGGPPKNSGEEFYQTQLDTYHLAGVVNGMTMSGFGYLIYSYPKSYDATGRMEMGTEVFELRCSEERIRTLIDRAVDCLLGGQPDHNPQCEICRFAQVRVNAALSVIAQSATTQVLASI